MFNPGHGGAEKSAGAVRKRVPFALIGCCVAFGAITPSSAAVSGPGSGSEGPISWRYQAFWCDTAALRGVGRLTAGVGGAGVTAHPGFGALRASFRSGASGLAIERYQLRNVISNSHSVVSRGIPETAVRSSDRTCSKNASWIESATTKTTPPSGPTDARRLFQLALALAAAYVLFLVARFWTTREHRGRVGSAARS